MRVCMASVDSKVMFYQNAKITLQSENNILVISKIYVVLTLHVKV